MAWLWPDLLLSLGLIPFIVAVYIWILRRKCRYTVHYSSLSLLQKSLVQPSFLRRHLPFILFTCALTSLVIALARPIAPEEILAKQTTIILTLDISRSMCMQDISPNRLEVARATALSFIQHPVLGTQVGIVAFAGFPELAQEPTTDPELLENAITNLTTGPETAIGSAILQSLDAIAKVDKRVAPSEEIDIPPEASSEQPNPPESPRKNFVPHIIVLLTDGASNTGPPPLLAAQEAAERGVRIYSIGFGTSDSAIIDCWNLFLADSTRSPGLESQAGAASSGNGPDYATLKQIAKITGGEFYSATSAAELHMVFQKLHQYIALTNQTIEVSVYFVAIGAILAIAALILTFFWHLY